MCREGVGGHGKGGVVGVVHEDRGALWVGGGRGGVHTGAGCVGGGARWLVAGKKGAGKKGAGCRRRVEGGRQEGGPGKTHVQSMVVREEEERGQEQYHQSTATIT